jgi:uncharacterized protein (TIGR00159 family)
VKKSLLDLRVSSLRPTEKNAAKDVESRSNEEVERCIAAIIKALQNMSKNNVGALIVLSRNNLPRQILQSGIAVDAEISSQMLEGIFFPKSPLHDGAMVIANNKIEAARCILPITQNTNLPGSYGLRHRAGIGITENSDCIAIVVSEETGSIRIIKGGKVYDVKASGMKAKIKELSTKKSIDS